jgi:effector-binding domain-containing protein
MREEPKVIETVAQPVLSVRAKIKVGEIPSFMGKAFGEVAAYMQRKRIPITGPPFSLYRSWSYDGFDVEAGFPVANAEKGEGTVKASSLPSGKVATMMHVGRYENLGKSYSMLETWIKAKGYVPGSCMWEVYLNSPEEVSSPEELMTQMFWPIK